MPVTYELPATRSEGLIGGDIALPDPDGTDFLAELSGPMPEIREDVFLAEPSAPLKSFPEAGTLMEEPGDPDPDAIPISNVSELIAMADGGSYVLTTDIDLTGTTWKPLTAENAVTLDGQGHVIKGLTPTSTSYTGLFGKTADLTVRNLIMQDVKIPHKEYAAALSAYTSGNLLIENCLFDGITFADIVSPHDLANVGGLVGEVTGTGNIVSFRACAINSTLNWIAPDDGHNHTITKTSIGSIAGKVTASNVQVADCLSRTDWDLTGYTHNPNYPSNIGGMFGSVSADANFSLLRSCVSGSISGGLLYTAGLVYSLSAPVCTVRDCAFTGTLGMVQGGLVGVINSTNTTFSNCRINSSISITAEPNTYYGGMVGFFSNADSACVSFTDCLSDADISITASPKMTASGHWGYVGGILGGAPLTSSFVGCLSTGDLLLAKDQAGTFAVGNLVGCTRLKSQLSFLRCENRGAVTGNYSAGFIGFGDSATHSFTDCKNSGTITGSYYSGGLIGRGLLCTMDNCLNTGSIIGYRIGGLAGELNSLNTTSFRNCRSSGSISEASNGILFAGGLIGSAKFATFFNCAACLSNVQSNIIGGLAGSCSGYIEQCATKVTALGGGGLVNETPGSLTICDSFASLTTSTSASAGGLLCTASKKDAFVSFYNCATQISFTAQYGSYDDTQGGLVGSCAAPLLISQCWTDGEIRFLDMTNAVKYNHSAAGGLAGALTGSSSSIENCQSSVDISGAALIGGLIGQGSNVAICDSWADGSLCTVNSGYEDTINMSSSSLGGIAGRLSGSIANCSFLGSIRPSSSIRPKSSGHTWGGIAGSMTGTIRGCTVSKPIVYTLETFILETASAQFGGIAGSFSGNMLDCISLGIHVECIGPSPWNIRIGGLAGYADANSKFENCRVEGPVYGSYTRNGYYYSDPAYLCVGGLTGQSLHPVSISGCAVFDDVGGNMTIPDYVYTQKKNNFALGAYVGLVGSSVPSSGICYTDSCSFFGSVNTDSSSHAGININYYKYTNASTPFVGVGICETTDVPAITPPETPTEDYTVIVKDIQDDASVVPIAGASVYVDNVLAGTTDEMGKVHFDSKTISSSSLVRISAQKTGYFESTIPTFLADGGTSTLYVRKKEPGEIYFKSAFLEETDYGVVNLLSGTTSLRIIQLDTDGKSFTAEVDWNDMDEEGRMFCLTNEEQSKYIMLTSGHTTLVTLPEMFDAGEDIYLMAKATYGGETVIKKQLLPVKVQAVNVHIPTGTGEQQVGGERGNKFLYFLNGLDLKLNIGDLAERAGTIGYKDGVLSVKFKNNASENKKQISVWNKFSETAEFSGEIEIPITNFYEGEWKGSATIAINDKADADLSNTAVNEYNKDYLQNKYVNKWTYDFLIAGVPCFLETKFKVGGSASLGIHGPYDQIFVNGQAAVNGEGSIYGGVGGSVPATDDQLQLRFGSEGQLKTELPIKFDTQKDPGVFLDPTIKGALAVKAVAKAFVLDVEAALDVGKFVWNKTGVTWTVLGEEVGSSASGGSRSLSVPASAWQPLSLDQTAGGGFREGTAPLTRTASSGAEVRYENLSSISENALTVENGAVVLYFTADDGSGTGGLAADHTVLWRCVRQEDGSWSTPSAVSSVESGFPSSPSADGPFVVWVESTQTDSLDAMLASTQIKVALNGQTIHTFETEGHVYSPKVSASEDGTSAMVSWYSDSTVTSNTLIGSTPSLYYASYQNGNWSEPTRVNTPDTPIQTTPSVADNKLWYRTANGSLYSGTSLVTSNLNGRSAFCGNIVACFDARGTLTLRKGDALTIVNTDYTNTQDPILLQSDGIYYLFWPETNGIRCMTSSNGTSWSNPVLLVSTEFVPHEISAVVSNGIPHLVFTQNRSGNTGSASTDLYTDSVPTDGIDLVLQELSYDSDTFLSNGYLTLQGKIFNNSLASSEAITVTVTDETGACVYTHTFSETTSPGDQSRIFCSFAVDTAAEHTYTVHIAPVTAQGTAIDLDPADNTLSLSVGQPCAKIVDASFLETAEGPVQLQAMVRNTGLSVLSDLTVKISTVDGETVLSKTYGKDNAIPTGSIRQVLVDNAKPDTYYEISLLCNGEVLDSAMLMFEDPEAQHLAATGVTVTDQIAQLTLYGQNQTVSSCKAILALYQDGKMAAAGVQTLSTLNGNQKLEIALSDSLPVGNYTYKVFFLTDDNTFTPLSGSISGSTVIK